MSNSAISRASKTSSLLIVFFPFSLVTSLALCRLVSSRLEEHTLQIRDL